MDNSVRLRNTMEYTATIPAAYTLDDLQLIKMCVPKLPSGFPCVSVRKLTKVRPVCYHLSAHLSHDRSALKCM